MSRQGDDTCERSSDDQPDERSPIAEVDGLDRQVDCRVHGECGMRVEPERQSYQQDRSAPSRTEPRGTAARQRETGRAHADERVGVAARSERARVARREEARQPGSKQARLSILVAQVDPHEHRDHEEQHGVQHVIAETLAEQCHRDERRRPEVLRDVR